MSSKAAPKTYEAIRERILIIDDDPALRASLRRYLQKHGFVVDEADSCASAETVMRSFTPDVALIDFRLPDGECIALLPRLRHIDPACALLVLTGYGSIDLAVRAVKEGATDFLTKPIDMGALLRAIHMSVSGAYARANSGVVEPFFGENAVMQTVRKRMNDLADSSDPVLFVGPEGSGRRTLARWLHARGRRADAPFIEVNCNDDDAEARLFGFDLEAPADGSLPVDFLSSRPGVIEAADTGTIFLRDLGRAPDTLRAKVLRLLHEGKFRRLGGAHERTARVRVIASVDRDLGDKGVDGDLRAEFEGSAIRVPPLRKREEDIVPLARHLISLLAARHGRTAASLSSDAEAALRARAWAGNVRELENVLESAILLATDPRLTEGDLPSERGSLARRRAHLHALAEGSVRPSPPETLPELERKSILQALREEDWRVEAAARRLGIPRSTLYYRLKAMGIPLRRSDPSNS